MAFLNKTMLAAKASDAVVDEHPMLKEQDVPLNVKMVYLQGCVLAAVLNNGALSHAKENEIVRLGKSLHLPEGEVAECISTVTSLVTDEEKEQFVGELFSVLSGDFFPKFFLRDFEEMLKEGGVVPAEMTDYLNFFGSSLCKNENWRADITSCDEISALTGCRDWRSEIAIDRQHDLDPADRLSVSKQEQKPAAPMRSTQNEEGKNKALLRYCIDHETCVECGACAGMCARNAIKICSDGRLWIDFNACNNCGDCVSFCPSDSIYNTKDSPCQIDPRLCVGCGACVGVCPCEAIEMSPIDGCSQINPGKCVGCGACADSCPADAVVQV